MLVEWCGHFAYVLGFLKKECLNWETKEHLISNHHYNFKIHYYCLCASVCGVRMLVWGCSHPCVRVEARGFWVSCSIIVYLLLLSLGPFDEPGAKLAASKPQWTRAPHNAGATGMCTAMHGIFCGWGTDLSSSCSRGQCLTHKALFPFFIITFQRVFVILILSL